MKYLSLFIISCLLSTTAFSQEAKRTVYFDSEYIELPDETGATYIRLFLGVDAVKTTYQVREYTADGHLRFIANSSSNKFLKYEGPCTWFGSNGQPLKTGFYSRGQLDSVFTEYYENGQISLESIYSKGKRIFNNSWDSTGKAELIDGNGWLKIRDDTTGVIIETGKVANGNQDSTWTYYDKKGVKESEIVFSDGKFVKGTRYDETGKTSTFKAMYTAPEFPGGQNALSAFIRKTLRYPPEDLKKGISGLVGIAFTIQEDGKLSKIAVHFGVSETLNKEALRVISKMPDWSPGTMRGKIVSTRFVLPIKFSMVE